MSCSRHCAITLCDDQKWYVFLANEEYGEYEDSTAYGSFDTEEIANDFVFNGPHCNPGGMWTDNSGKTPAPKISPNGSRVLKPTKQYGCWEINTPQYRQTGPFIFCR